MTLTQLAKQCAMSPAFLSRIETHKFSVTIANLELLADALDVPISTFFEGDEITAPIVLCRAGKGIYKRFRGEKSFVFELLATSKRGKLMEPLLIDISAGKEKQKLISHLGEEFNYVVKGEICLMYGKQEIRLKEGDSVYYDATVPHVGLPVTGKPGIILSIIASQDYVFHGDITNLLNGKLE